MLICPVCGVENGDLDVVCKSCKGFMQAKVDTLDLFSTVWGLLEQPRRTFRRIALAKSKNYVILLSAALGVAIVYLYFWYWQVAVHIPSLVTLLGIGLLVGPPLGNVFVALCGAVIGFILRARGINLTSRNTRAVLAYACVPLVASLLVVMPLEIAIFGSYFFDNNPPPMVINPVAYIGLVGLDALAGVWSVILLMLGLRYAAGTPWIVSIIATAVVVGAMAGLVMGLRLV
jgi:hypothetical protein